MPKLKHIFTHQYTKMWLIRMEDTFISSVLISMFFAISDTFASFFVSSLKASSDSKKKNNVMLSQIVHQCTKKLWQFSSFKQAENIIGLQIPLLASMASLLMKFLIRVVFVKQSKLFTVKTTPCWLQSIQGFCLWKIYEK